MRGSLILALVSTTLAAACHAPALNPPTSDDPRRAPTAACTSRMLDTVVRNVLTDDRWSRRQELLLVAIYLDGFERFDPSELNLAWQREGVRAHIVYIHGRPSRGNPPELRDHHVSLIGLWGSSPDSGAWVAAMRSTGSCTGYACCTVVHSDVCDQLH